MPDWKRLVAERLAASKLTSEVQREVTAEIAEHLEDCCDELVRAGSVDPERETLAEVADWNALCRKIRRSKDGPMNFARKVAMPGVAAVILALTDLKVFVYLFVAPEPCGVNLQCIRVTADGPAYLPWLATMPLAGALAAVLARRMGARPPQRLAAALFPALYLAVEVFVIGLLYGFFWRIPISWVIVPGIACAIGAAAFLGGGRHPIEAPPIKQLA